MIRAGSCATEASSAAACASVSATDSAARPLLHGLGPLDRLLAAVNPCHTMSGARPYRQAFPPDAIATQLLTDISAGSLDADADMTGTRGPRAIHLYGLTRTNV